MKRALQLTGLCVIGVGIKPQVDAGGHVEPTAYVADYDAFEGRFGMVVEGAVHALGFRRSDTDAVAFGADCKTRSQMSINMNGMCRSSGTGNADEEVSGGEEARARDRIDRKAVQQMDSVLNPHSDEECVANTIQWPHGPGGWGFSQEDAHTILLPPPAVGPRYLDGAQAQPGAGPQGIPQRPGLLSTVGGALRGSQWRTAATPGQPNAHTSPESRGRDPRHDE